MQDQVLPLRDIHLPEPISWWPPAPGWWMLLAAAILLVITIYLFAWFRKRRRLKRTVLAELAMIQQRYQEHPDALQLVKKLSTLMRRASISFYPRKDTASLTGNAWLQYLDKTSEIPAFEYGAGEILATAPYLPHNSRVDVNADELIAICEQWLENQPVKGIEP